MKTTVGQLRRLIREQRDLQELFGKSPSFGGLLDDILADLQDANKKVEQAHGMAPAGAAKAIVTGLHSDLFNKISEFRGHVEQLKALARKG